MYETDADRLAYVQAFGVPASADRGDLIGIFDPAYTEAVGIEDTAPMLECLEADVRRLQLAKGAVVRVADANYRVRRWEPDGTGMGRLILGA